MVFSSQQRHEWKMARRLHLRSSYPALYRRHRPPAAFLLLLFDFTCGLHAVDRLRNPCCLRLFSLSTIKAAADPAVFFPVLPGRLRVFQPFRYQARLIPSAALADGGFVGRQLHRRFSTEPIARERALPMVDPILFLRSGRCRIGFACSRMGSAPRNFLDHPARRRGVGRGWNCYGGFLSTTPAFAPRSRSMPPCARSIRKPSKR